MAAHRRPGPRDAVVPAHGDGPGHRAGAAPGRRQGFGCAGCGGDGAAAQHRRHRRGQGHRRQRFGARADTAAAAGLRAAARARGGAGAGDRCRRCRRTGRCRGGDWCGDLHRRHPPAGHALRLRAAAALAQRARSGARARGRSGGARHARRGGAAAAAAGRWAGDRRPPSRCTVGCARRGATAMGAAAARGRPDAADRCRRGAARRPLHQGPRACGPRRLDHRPAAGHSGGGACGDRAALRAGAFRRGWHAAAVVRHAGPVLRARRAGARPPAAGATRGGANDAPGRQLRRAHHRHGRARSRVRRQGHGRASATAMVARGRVPWRLPPTTVVAPRARAARCRWPHQRLVAHAVELARAVHQCRAAGHGCSA